MAKAAGLIFSLFDIALARQVPFGILQYIPFLYKGRVLSLGMYPISKLAFWFMVGDIVLLTLIGGRPVEEPYVVIG